MGIGKLGRDIKLEVVMVWNDGISQFDDSAA